MEPLLIEIGFQISCLVSPGVWIQGILWTLDSSHRNKYSIKTKSQSISSTPPLLRSIHIDQQLLYWVRPILGLGLKRCVRISKANTDILFKRIDSEINSFVQYFKTNFDESYSSEGILRHSYFSVHEMCALH